MTTLMERPEKTQNVEPLFRTPEPRFFGILEMTAEDWSAVRDNPRQRDTAARASRAKHLHTLDPVHSRVNMARLPNGQCFKLDGHTRGYLWSQKKPEGPAKVYADVWECASIEQVKELYSKYDSSAAVENVTDKIYGAVREKNVEFHSELLKSKRFAGAMRVASSMLQGFSYADNRDVYDFFGYWLPELTLLDECNPGRHRFHGGVAAAALLSFRRYGPEAAPFWKAFAIGGGSKSHGEMDAVQALEERMERMRAARQISGSGNTYQIVRICLSAFDAYLGCYSYASNGNGKGIKALQENSLTRWLAAAAKTRRRW